MIFITLRPVSSHKSKLSGMNPPQNCKLPALYNHVPVDYPHPLG